MLWTTRVGGMAAALVLLLPAMLLSQGANTPCACTGGAGAGGYCVICRQKVCGAGPCFCGYMYVSCNNCSVTPPNIGNIDGDQTCIINAVNGLTCDTQFRAAVLYNCGQCATGPSSPCFTSCVVWYKGGDRTCQPRGERGNIRTASALTCKAECSACIR
jgi:hypothetical protein